VDSTSVSLPGCLPWPSAACWIIGGARDLQAVFPRTLELMESYTILLADRNGWIELSTDGEQMWVEVEKR